MKIKKIAIGFGVLLVGAQAFRIDKSVPEIENEKDFISVTMPSAEIEALLKKSCYDCHSNQTTYPWYTEIAPVSWWIKHHINEGREELNFSEWADYSERRKDHKLKECVEMVQENEMPMSSYTLLHHDAELTTKQKEDLIAWFNSLRTGESDKPKR